MRMMMMSDRDALALAVAAAAVITERRRDMPKIGCVAQSTWSMGIDITPMATPTTRCSNLLGVPCLYVLWRLTFNQSGNKNKRTWGGVLGH
ncbi:hypothetical protein PCASD_06023 [Puccinia coronata f. sp. avenae]|uniref:Uncharacterized protein n=1 Tax=Puccinia coronata f. sp. avenae TaxID=200324 RepID=A0A2N5VA20_9BASI|nr:hypothetical protein PCASD_06023 [Puccinia coronata f. sp. avenae]